MDAIFDLVPVIADVISSHCPGAAVRERFVRACLSADWDEARHMMDGMLAEPWHLQGHQEKRLREFRELLMNVNEMLKARCAEIMVCVNLAHRPSPNRSSRS